MVTLAEALERLYAADPDTFIAQRTALVAEARAVKDRALATEIQALRRPTRSAWLVNQLARRHDTELGHLLELGPELSRAHTGGSMAQLREVSSLRRQVLDGLVRLARDLARSAGQEPTQATLAEVRTTLDAALTHPEVGAAVRAGVLTRAPESAAAFPTDLFAPLAEVIPLPERARTDDRAETERAAAERAEAERAEAERKRAERMAAERRQAEQTLSAAEDAHATALARLRELDDLLAQARADLDTAEHDLAAAREALDRVSGHPSSPPS